jgi:aminotransferase
LLNTDVSNLGPYASKSIARRVEAESRIISLSLGEPAFGPPPSAVEEMKRIAHSDAPLIALKRYEESLGSPKLREAIAAYYSEYSGLVVRPDSEILITHGGSGALTAALLACTRPGDEVLIGDPSYMLYERVAIVLGRVPKTIPRFASEGYRYDLDLIRSLITACTSALIVNSPENPTGYVCPDEEMRGLLEVCRAHGITLIHDEVYDQFTFDRPHRPAIGIDGFDDVVQINSTSKKFGVPGLRIGWMVSTADRVGTAAKVQDYTSLAVSRYAERCAEALFASEGLSQWFAATRQELRRRIALGIERLSSIPGVSFPSAVDGGMFLFPSVAGLAAELGERTPASAGDAVSEWLLEIARVAVVPGRVYGSNGAASIRFVLCGPEAELVEALDRIMNTAMTALVPVSIR